MGFSAPSPRPTKRKLKCNEDILIPLVAFFFFSKENALREFNLRSYFGVNWFGQTVKLRPKTMLLRCCQCFGEKGRFKNRVIVLADVRRAEIKA